jgi:hypothetical protein
MFVFEWVFGWFGRVAPPFTKPGVVVRTNRGNAVVRTNRSNTVVKTFAYIPIVRGR